MKRIISLFLCVILLLAGTSCSLSGLPSSSDNFSKEFLESFPDVYFCEEANTAFISCCAEEASYSYKQSDGGSLEYSFAIINGIDKEMFVAVKEHHFILMPGGYLPKLKVYQTANSPSPMKDWSIKSISLYESITCNWYEIYDNVSEFISHSRLLIKYKTGESDNIIQAFKEAYDNQNTSEVDSIYYVTKDYGDHLLNYYNVLIEFEQSENIVWLSTIMTDTENKLLYLDCKKYDRETGEINDSAGVISPDVYNELSKVLNISLVSGNNTDSE